MVGAFLLMVIQFLSVMIYGVTGRAFGSFSLCDLCMYVCMG